MPGVKLAHMGATFSERLKQALDDAGMKPADLARAVKVSPATVTLWLNDQTDPNKIRANTMRKVAQVVNRRQEYLMSGRGPQSAGEEPDIRTTLSEIGEDIEALAKLIRLTVGALSETTPGVIAELRQTVVAEIAGAPRRGSTLLPSMLWYLDALSARESNNNTSPHGTARSPRKKGGQ